jgi:diguanylate cyclase (GGDEF)-like protein/PAS domain S-box-containing protein
MPADARAAPVDHAALTHLLDRFAHVSAGSHDARELTDWLLRQTSEITGWPVGHALLVDPHGAVTAWLSTRTKETEWQAYMLAADGLAMRTPTGIIDRVMATRRPGWVTDIGNEADYPRAAAARAAGLRGVFALPVIRGSHVVAVLQFLSADPIEPGSDFLDGMTVAGFLLGTAFDRLQIRGDSVDKPSRLHRIMDAGGRAFFAVVADGRIAAWTNTAERLFGWTHEEAMYRRSDDLLMLPARHAGDAWRQELVLHRRDGSTFPAELTRWSVPGAAVRHYLFCRDLNEQHQRAANITQDPLTGLLNRAGMLDLLEQRLARGGHGDGHGPVLLLVGLQRFKEIDYSVDHRVAEESLRIIGARLVAFAEREQQRPLGPAAPVDVSAPAVARVAGDEFAILFDRSDGASDIADLAKHAMDAIAEPFHTAGRRLALTAHIGAAEPLAGSDARSWFGDAEAALYRSRNDRTPLRSPHAHFEIEGLARRRGGSWSENLPDEMRTALREQQFELFYQPIFTLPDHGLAGAEALIRWHHPQHGLLLPGSFIDAAEDSGMIAPVGEWVLNTAARQLRGWDGSGLSVAVNLSARQLADPGIVGHLAEAVDALGAPRDSRGLIVEMTESVLMADPAVAATRIGQFRDMGVQVSIDDFGTGYSSLAYLKWFDVDVIKIDMSFVHGLETSRADVAIVRAIIELARELGLRVVAEGVETDEQLRHLIELGCTHVQGFRRGRPSRADDFTAQIRRPSRTRVAAE